MKVNQLFNKYPENTVGYWLNQITDAEVRRKAFKNSKHFFGSDDRLYLRCNKISQAIDKSMVWFHTPEGAGYWSKICKTYEREGK